MMRHTHSMSNTTVENVIDPATVHNIIVILNGGLDLCLTKGKQDPKVMGLSEM